MSFFLKLLCCLLFLNVVVHGRKLSINEDLELEAQLKILNKPSTKSFQDKYGHYFDCVDVYKQPAFDNPLLKNHKIQMKPSTSFVGHTGRTRKNALKFGFKEKCPPGTVLIKRVTKDDLIKAKNQPRRLNPYYDLQYKMKQNDHFSFMSFYAKDGQVFHGASASMDIIEVDGVSDTQSTGASMITKNVGSGSLSVIQLGWKVNYHSYGDNITRFLTSWTSGGSQPTGCENMNCPGYIQLSHSATPGTIIPKGDIELSVSLDKNTGNWFLHFVDNENEVLGYFPKELFNNLADADNVQMGGIVNSNYDEPSPKMGTGYLPSSSNAAKFNRVRLANQNDRWIRPYRKIDKIAMYNDLNKTYYDIKEMLDDGTTGYNFAYGGPGGLTQRGIYV